MLIRLILIIIRPVQLSLTHSCNELSLPMMQALSKSWQKTKKAQTLHSAIMLQPIIARPV